MKQSTAIFFGVFLAIVAHVFHSDEDYFSSLFRRIPFSSNPKAHSDNSNANRITELTRMADNLQSDAIARQIAAVNEQRGRLEGARRKMPFFPSVDEKANVQHLESEHQRALLRLSDLENQRNAVLQQIKPLHGIWSVAFYEEQRHAIRETMRSIHHSSYNSAWWSTLFNPSNESFKDMVVQFFLEWMVSYMVMLPFAAVYFMLIQTPHTIWQYSARPSDLLTAVVAWALSGVAFLLPVALFGYLLREVLMRYRKV